MVQVAELTARLTVQDEMTPGLAKAGQAVDAVGTKAGGMGAKAAVGFGILGTAAAGAFAATVGSAAQFEQQMANVNTIAGLSTSGIQDLGESVLALSGPTGQAPATLAAGLYEIQSAGFSGQESLDLLEQAAIGATAGMTTTDVAASALTSVMGAFGDQAGSAEQVMDTLFSTVNQGKLNFTDLANNLSATLPVAAALGVGLNELGSAYASLTLQSFSAAGAETGISAIMAAALNPTKALTTAVQDLGHTSVEAFLNAQPEGEKFNALLGLLDQAAGGSNEAMTKLLGTKEATAAAMALLNEGEAGYVNQLGKMNAALAKGGVTQASFIKQQATLSAGLTNVKNAATVAATIIGSQLTPALTAAADFALGLVAAFQQLPESFQTGIALAIAAAAALGVIGAAAAVLIPVGSALGTVFAAIGIGSFAAAAPILLVAAALAALYVAYQTNFLGFADGVNAVAGAVAAGFGQIVGFVQQLVQAFQAAGLEGVLAKIKLAILGAFGPDVLAFAEPFITVVETAIAVVTNLVEAFDALRQGDLAGFFTNLGEAWLAPLRGLMEAFQELWAALSGVDWGGVLSAIGAALSGLGGSILSGIEAGASALWGWLSGLASRVPEAVGDAAGWLVGKGKDLMVGLFDGINEQLPALTDWLAGLGGSIAAGLGDFASTLLSKGTDLMVGLLGGITAKWPEVDAWLAALPADVAATVGDFTQTLLAKGSELIGGLLNGITQKWPDVDSWLVGLAADAAASVGDMATALYDEGAALIQGLWDGAKAKWDEFTAWLSGLKPDFPDISWPDPFAAGAPAGGGVQKLAAAPAVPGAFSEAPPPKGHGAAWMQEAAGAGAPALPAPDLSAWQAVPGQMATIMAEIGTAVTLGFGQINTGVGMQVQALATTVTTAFTTMVTGVTAQVAALQTAVSTAFTTTAISVRTSATGMQTAVTTAFTAMATAARTQATALQTAVSTAFTTMAISVRTSATTLQTAVTTAFTTMTTGATTQVKTLQTAVTTAFTAMATGVSTSMTTATTAVTTGMTSMSNAATTGMNAVKTAISSGFAEVVTAATTAMNNLEAEVLGSLNGLASVAGAAGQAIGDAIGSGINSGIAGWTSAIAATAAAAVNAAEAAALGAADAASPSKVFRRIGGFMGEGMALGILDEMPKMVAAARSAVEATIEAARRGVFLAPALDFGALMAAPAPAGLPASSVRSGPSAVHGLGPGGGNGGGPGRVVPTTVVHNHFGEGSIVLERGEDWDAHFEQRSRSAAMAGWRR